MTMPLTNAPGLSSQPLAATAAHPSIEWTDATREHQFWQWLSKVSQTHHLLPDTVRPASADASFRRYFRVDNARGTHCIVMDAPPDKENCRPFVQVAQLMEQAGLRVPSVLEWDEPLGFMLLSDLGSQTLLDVLNLDRPHDNLPHYNHATAALLTWQQASQPGVLPEYNEALLRRELQLFPDWYLTQHRGLALDSANAAMLTKTFDTIVARNLAGPKVFVHRDFMPRNLMVPPAGYTSASAVQALGVLDFQDAVYGPITYDIASLMRDAFLTWEEDLVLDVTIRYWEQARKLGMLDFEGWSQDFGEFYRAVEWMGLQRHLKILGIFARLTLRDGKPKYLADTPRFIMYVRNTASRYRELGPLLRLIDQVENLQAATGFAYGRM